MTVYITKIVHKASGTITIGNAYENKALAEAAMLHARLEAPDWHWILEERELL